MTVLMFDEKNLIETRHGKFTVDVDDDRSAIVIKLSSKNIPKVTVDGNEIHIVISKSPSTTHPCMCNTVGSLKCPVHGKVENE